MCQEGKGVGLDQGHGWVILEIEGSQSPDILEPECVKHQQHLLFYFCYSVKFQKVSIYLHMSCKIYLNSYLGSL